MNNRDKSLFNHLSSVQKILFEFYNDDITIRYKNSYSGIYIYTARTFFEWKILEPISNYCTDKDVNWQIEVYSDKYLAIRIWK